MVWMISKTAMIDALTYLPALAYSQLGGYLKNSKVSHSASQWSFAFVQDLARLFYGGSREYPQAGFGPGNGAASPPASRPCLLLLLMLTNGWTKWCQAYLLLHLLNVPSCSRNVREWYESVSYGSFTKVVEWSSSYWLRGFKAGQQMGSTLCDSFKSAKCFVNFFSYNFVNSEPRLKKVKDRAPT